MKISAPLSIFIMVSIAIHAGVVVFSNTTSIITLPSTQGSAMAIRIKEITVKNHKSVKNKKPVKTIKQVNTNSLNSENKIQENITSEKKSSRSKAQVISIIYNQLNQHFSYPRLAQKRNWQGKVLLSLRVSAKGKIDKVQLKNSSGYPVLDDAAIRSLLKVKTLPKISSWLSGDIYLNLPVIYRLIEEG